MAIPLTGAALAQIAKHRLLANLGVSVGANILGKATQEPEPSREERLLGVGIGTLVGVGVTAALPTTNIAANVAATGLLSTATSSITGVKTPASEALSTLQHAALDRDVDLPIADLPNEYPYNSRMFKKYYDQALNAYADYQRAYAKRLEDLETEEARAESTEAEGEEDGGDE